MRLLMIAALVFLSFGCSRHREPEKMAMICDIDASYLKDHKIISLRNGQDKLNLGEVDKSTYEINSNGCALIPKSSSKPFTVKAGGMGLNLTQEQIPDGFSTSQLETLLDDFNIWSQCGMNGEPDKVFFHFEDVESPIYFQSVEMKKAELAINEYNCAATPNGKGRIISGEKSFIVDKTSDLVEVDMSYYPSGFSAVCNEIGKKDKIVEIVSNHLGADDCETMVKRISEIDGASIFVDQGIEKINALHNLDLKIINLSGNNIREISSLSDKVQSLDLINNPLMFIDSLPKDLRSISIENAPDLCDLSALTSLVELSTVSLRQAFNLKSLVLNPKVRLTTIKVENVPLSTLKMNWENVTYLSAFEESFSGFSEISIPNLSSADLTYNNIDIAAKNPHNLKILHLDFLPLNPDLGFLKQSKIKFLKLSGKVSDISSLEGSEVETLDMHGTGVQDLSPLSNSTSLKILNISGTNVTDLRPLRNLPNLTSVNIGGLDLIKSHCPVDAKSEFLKKLCQGVK